ncbi:GNAT family N-acetyltransferase [Nocardia xishanensis]
MTPTSSRPSLSVRSVRRTDTCAGGWFWAWAAVDEHGQAVGVVTAHSDWRNSENPNAPDATLDIVYVAPPRRGEAIGLVLLRAARRELAGEAVTLYRTGTATPAGDAVCQEAGLPLYRTNARRVIQDPKAADHTFTPDQADEIGRRRLDEVAQLLGIEPV